MRAIKHLVVIFIALSFITILFAQQRVWVKGYFKNTGTYVTGHWRTVPDGNPFNNYSYPGNYNPNTGKITTGNPSTYLKNYYSKSSSSSYYNINLINPNPNNNSDDLWNYDYKYYLDLDININELDLDSDLKDLDLDLNYDLDLDSYDYYNPDY